MKTARRKSPQAVRDPFIMGKREEEKLELKKHIQQKNMESDSKVWIPGEWENDSHHET